MADIQKIIEDVISESGYIKETINSKDKITKRPTIRYIVVVPKFIEKVQLKKRADYQKDIEAALLKKKIDKKYINTRGRTKSPNDSGSFLATTIDATINKIETIFFIILKEESSALVLLPSLINPTKPVVGEWLTAIEMKKRILQHIDSSKVTNQKDKDAYHDLLNAAIKPSTNMIKYDVPKNENNAEFFELCSAINLASLLKAQNSYIVNTLLNMPDKYKEILSKNTPTIYIPPKSNFALLDFYIDFRGVSKNSAYKQEGKEARSLKISVKAKLSAAAEGKFATGDTNTIKFQDLFNKNVKKVDKWYNDLSKYNLAGLKKNQYGPKIVAKAGVEGFNTSIGVMYPIRAVGKLLSDSNTATAMRNELLKTILFYAKKTSERVKDFKTKSKYSNDQVANAYMDIIINISSKLLTYRKESPLVKEMVTDKKNFDIVLLTLPLILKSSVDPKINENVTNIGVICERVLQNASKEGDPKENHNYFYMFYDQVLEKKHIIYAVATRYGSNQLKFKYLAYANWMSEYKNWKDDMEKAWISLRGKSNPNKLGEAGALGINL
jgi:hypothetical protein